MTTGSTLGICGLVALMAVTGAAEAGMWKYVDEKGKSHFVSERAVIPPRYRDTAQELGAAGGGSVTQMHMATPPPPAPVKPAAAAAPAPQQEAAVSGAPDDAAGDVSNYQQTREKAAAEYGAMNAVNPVMDTTSAKLEALPASGLASMKLPPQLEALQKKINPEKIKRLTEIMQSPKTMETLKAMTDNPYRLHGLGALFALSLILAYIRHRIGKAGRGFIYMLGVRFVLFLALIAGSFGITYGVYGEGPFVLMQTLWRALV